MSIRLYTICAVAVTASAMAGLLVGGMFATDRKSTGEPRLTPVVSDGGPTMGGARR